MKKIIRLGSINELYIQALDFGFKNNELFEFLFELIKKINIEQINFNKSEFSISYNEYNKPITCISLFSIDNYSCYFWIEISPVNVNLFIGTSGYPLYEGKSYTNAKQLIKIKEILNNFFLFPLEEVIIKYKKGLLTKSQIRAIIGSKKVILFSEQNFLFSIFSKRMIKKHHYKPWIENGNIEI